MAMFWEIKALGHHKVVPTVLVVYWLKYVRIFSVKRLLLLTKNDGKIYNSIKYNQPKPITLIA